MTITTPRRILLAVSAMIILVAITWIFMGTRRPGPADELAQCLTQRGVKMYGAYWCPHCLSQKKLFGKSWQYITYVECSLPGGRGQTKECTDAGIQGYPTWVIPGGASLNGEQSFDALARAGGCAQKNNDVIAPVNEGNKTDESSTTRTTE